MDFKREEIDLLKKIEELTAKINQIFGERSRNVFSRYPMTFALLILFGVTLVIEGVKEIIREIAFFQNKPWVMLLAGLFVLAVTGTLYKKLNKSEPE